ncbi:MAG: response regulator transcription factor [Geodermatophilaceae bacterium]
MPDIRIALVDDHSIVRQGLRSILEREEGLEVVGEASSLPTALSMVAATSPDIVLLDLKLSTEGDVEGLELARMLTQRHPGVGVLVLTTFLDERLVVQAIQHGAKGYVLKDVDAVELIRSIRAVHRGESALTPTARPWWCEACMATAIATGTSDSPTASSRFCSCWRTG